MVVSATVTEQEAEVQSVAEPTSARRIARWIGLLALTSLAVGALMAVFWSSVVDLPTYLIGADGSAVFSERSWVKVVSADAWFVLCAVPAGIGLGLITWRWFHELGWPTPVLAAGAGLLSGFSCWQLGQLLGPGSFADRIAAAGPGDLVPISLELHSPSALAVWGFIAVAPVLLIASLGPEEAESPAETESEEVLDGPETVDERGVATLISAPSPK